MCEETTSHSESWQFYGPPDRITVDITIMIHVAYSNLTQWKRAGLIFVCNPEVPGSKPGVAKHHRLFLLFQTLRGHPQGGSANSMQISVLITTYRKMTHECVSEPLK